MSRLYTWLRQFFCLHRCYIEQMVVRNRGAADQLVACPCHRCGKLLFADYGLALPAILERRP